MTNINTKYPLIVESHNDNYTGYPFITLLVYGEENNLVIIDNYNKHHIYAYVLDYCNIEHVNEELIIKTAYNWYTSKDQYPISVEFSKCNLSEAQLIYKVFNINYVKRIIGPLPKYNMDIIKKTKRKKRKILDTQMKVDYKTLDIFT